MVEISGIGREEVKKKETQGQSHDWGLDIEGKIFILFALPVAGSAKL